MTVQSPQEYLPAIEIKAVRTEFCAPEAKAYLTHVFTGKLRSQGVQYRVFRAPESYAGTLKEYILARTP